MFRQLSHSYSPFAPTSVCLVKPLDLSPEQRSNIDQLTEACEAALAAADACATMLAADYDHLPWYVKWALPSVRRMDKCAAHALFDVNARSSSYVRQSEKLLELLSAAC